MRFKILKGQLFFFFFFSRALASLEKKIPLRWKDFTGARVGSAFYFNREKSNPIDVLEEILLGVKLPIDSLDENELFLSNKWLPNMLLIYIILIIIIIITSTYV